MKEPATDTTNSARGTIGKNYNLGVTTNATTGTTSPNTAIGKANWPKKDFRVGGTTDPSTGKPWVTASLKPPIYVVKFVFGNDQAIGGGWTASVAISMTRKPRWLTRWMLKTFFEIKWEDA